MSIRLNSVTISFTVIETEKLRALMEAASHALDLAKLGITQFPADQSIANLRLALSAIMTPEVPNCASCYKTPIDDSTITLKRINKENVPGIYMCQHCIGIN